jgi:hypothetical protein
VVIGSRNSGIPGKLLLLETGLSTRVWVPIELVYLDLGGIVVELISYEGVSVEPAPEKEHLGYRMIALEVDDMQKTADYLSTKGVEIVWGPRVRETYSRAEICDPNGYSIDFGNGSSKVEIESEPRAQDPLWTSTYIYKIAAAEFVGCL